MIKIQKATLDHFDAVYPLIENLNDLHNTKEDWYNIFIDNFHSRESYVGYVLLDNETVVGFLGLIFSKRKFHNHEINFCNIGNWIVSKEYRNKSINLLFPVLKLEDYVLTNFTASPTVCKIFKTLKFKELGNDFYIIPPIPSLGSFLFFKKEVNIIYADQVKKHLSKDELRIFNDHSNPDFNCKHILFKDEGGTCYIIAKTAYRNRLPFLHIHYISHANNFSRHIGWFKMLAPFKFNVVSIIIDKRFLSGEKLRHIVPYKLQSPRFYKSNIKNYSLDLNVIDHLYSEFVVLHI
jgi:hypothetical protein